MKGNVTLPSIIIDFDSTLVRCESLDLLAETALAHATNAASITRQIKAITDAGMEGKLSFKESLRQRLSLFRAHTGDVQTIVKRLKREISSSIAGHRTFFRQNADRIYVISGGFREYIVPVAEVLGLRPDHVLANTFQLDRDGWITGVDSKNPLSRSGGKTTAVRNLNLKGPIHVIGDGYTDYEITKLGKRVTFYAFTENVRRPAVIKVAHRLVANFDDYLKEQSMPEKHSYPREKLKVLLLEGIHERAVAGFREAGYPVEQVKDALSERELLKVMPGVALLGIRSKTKVTARVLEQAQRLLAIGTFCIGTDQVDLDTAAGRGVPIFNAPYSNTRSVVEAVLAEIIALERRLFDSSSDLHKGIWTKSAHGCREVRGRRLGIIGYGNIGSQLSVLAEALGMEVYYYDVIEKLSLGKARKCRSLHELLKSVDIVSMHVDGRASNRNLIGDREFRAMRDGAIFINFSRGSIVDIEALVKHLKRGKIGGAGIDVFPYEPKGNKERFMSELKGLPNVILTPHIGGSTIEAQENIGEFVATKLLEYVNNGSSFGAVNFPQIQLPTLKNAHRLLHVHANVPGILAHINGVLAANHINILGQYLKTTEKIGYVITDVNKRYNREVIDELRTIPHTIRFRVLY
jgi:D-3-phosphoglycerate dehydrogenase